MKQLIEYKLPDDGVVLIEVEKPSTDDEEPVSNSGDRVIQAQETFLQALSPLQPMIGAIREKVSGLNEPADEVEVKFGVKLTGGLNGGIITSGGEAAFEITLRWNKPS